MAEERKYVRVCQFRTFFGWTLHIIYLPRFLFRSFDEMAAYDLPAMFDYVRRVSGVEQVHYVGHSQGTMIGFAGFTTNKTLAAMVKRFYALAPVAMVANIESPIKRLAPYSRDISVSLWWWCLLSWPLTTLCSRRATGRLMNSRFCTSLKQHRGCP